MEKTREQLRAEALAALQIDENTPSSEIEAKFARVGEALKAYGEVLGVQEEPAPVVEHVEDDRELKAAIKEFTEKSQVPLARRAREVELDTERAREYPTKAADVVRQPADADWKREFHKASDHLHVIGGVVCGLDWERIEKNGFTDMDVARLRNTKAFHRYMDVLRRSGIKDLDTTTATGGLEWMDVSLSATAIDAIRLQPGAQALFDVWPMPTGVYQLPFVPGNVQTFLIAQIAVGTGWGNAAVPNQSPYVSAGVTMNAQKHGTLVALTAEAEEDAVFPVVDKIIEDVVRGMAEGRSDICINGDDTTGPPAHFDADTPGAVGAAHRRLLATGLRYLAITNVATQSMAVVNVDAYRGIRRQLGRFKQGGVWIVGSLGEEDMASVAQVETMAGVGNLATVLNGTIPRLLGYPVVLDNQVREDVSASGINTGAGPNTFTTTLCVNPRAFLWGERRSLQLRVVDAPWGIEQKAIYAAERIDFAQLDPGSAGNWPVAIGIAQAT